jgi:hypothetical protein
MAKKTHTEKVGVKAVSRAKQRDEAAASLVQDITLAKDSFTGELGIWVGENVETELQNRDQKVVGIATAAETLFDLRIKKEVRKEHVPAEELRQANTVLQEALKAAKIRKTPRDINTMMTSILADCCGVGRER